MKTTDTHVFFYTNQFSNFHKCKFIYKGIEFSNSEQAFMWCKAKYFENNDLADKMLLTTDPMSVKMMGRMVCNYKDDVWSTVRYQFMFEACLEKFRQNEYLKEILLNTGDKVLVEASPSDKIWGIGLGENDPLIYIESNWKGQNLLGKVLMDVRKTIREEA